MLFFGFSRNKRATAWLLHVGASQNYCVSHLSSQRSDGGLSMQVSLWKTTLTLGQLHKGPHLRSSIGTAVLYVCKHSKRQAHAVCVCCFVLLSWYCGIVTVPGSFLFRKPGVAGSLPCTLTTSLTTPVPSSSSSKVPTTTTLTTRGSYPGGSDVWAGPKFVRPHWLES